MRRIFLFIVFISFYWFPSVAQSMSVKQANDMYAAANYSGAAEIYEAVIHHQGVSPELYFNLANAYYKLGETGKSILNYERALRLSPTYDDARANLELAQLKVVDNIVQAPTFFVGRWIENLIKLLTSNQWLIVSFSLFVVSLVLVFLFVFAQSLTVRKLSFYAGITFLIICLSSFIFSGILKNQYMNHRYAIVMSGVVTVKSSPDKSGTDLFQLHEGTKVSIKSTLGKWTEIKLGNGNIGWIEQENIERI